MGPKKHLGQHFLTAPAYAKRIADAVPVGVAGGDMAVSAHERIFDAVPVVGAATCRPLCRDINADAHVLEIGPGRGALSAYLIERFPEMHLVEVDRDAVGVLKEKLGDGRYTVHNEDVMGFDFAKAGFPLHVVGNLPYNIGAMVIKKALMYAPDVLSCTFMVQKEVAARVVSAPHSRQNGWLSIFCQFFGAARLLFSVPPGAFFPRPGVDSAVFQIIIDEDVEKRLARQSWDDFFAFVDSGFSMRRKQLAKVMALKSGRHPKEFYADALSAMGMDASIRPEDLDVNGWLGFYRRVNL